MRKRMRDSVLPLASVIPMWMAALLILSVVLEKLNNQLLSPPNLIALFGNPAVPAHQPQSKRRRKRRKIEDAGQKAALLDGRGRRVQRRKSTDQNLNPRSASIGHPLQRASVNLRTRSGRGLEVQHQPPRAVERTVQLLLIRLPLLTLPAVGLEALQLKPIRLPCLGGVLPLHHKTEGKEMQLPGNQLSPPQGILAAQRPLQCSLAALTKTKTKRRNLQLDLAPLRKGAAQAQNHLLLLRSLLSNMKAPHNPLQQPL